MTDTEIAARISEGELHLFDELAMECRPRLRIIAMRYMHNADDAEDVVQTALSKAFRHIASYDGRARLCTWLTGITRYAAVDALRKRKAESALSLDDIPTDYHPADTSIESNPEQLAMRNVGIDAVRLAVTGLPPRLRDACVLVDLKDMQYDGAAVALGIPEGAMKSRLNRARGQLREKLSTARL